MELEEGDVVLCTVERIAGTVVFVKIQNGSQETEGSIVVSEIAPGRIRNLRDYVVPKKQIVCKILRIKNNNIELSLRRVTQKEKREVLEKAKKEKSYISMFKTVLGEKTPETVNKIKKENEDLSDFIEKIKKNSKELEKIVSKSDSEKLLKILRSQKPKKTTVKKLFSLRSTSPEGLEMIKQTLGNVKNITIKYLSAGNYSMETQAENPKAADNFLKEFILKIEQTAKQKNLSFALK